MGQIYESSGKSRCRQTPKFFRVQHEDSYTQQAQVQPNSSLAFSTELELEPDHDLTKERIERHLNWYNVSYLWTTFISVFDNRGTAEDRVYHHSRNRREHIRRKNLFIAEIVPGVLHPKFFQATDSDLKVPIWIDDLHSSDITKCNMWISIAEVRVTFKIPTRVGQDNEWLACGRINRNVIHQIIPYDGTDFHNPGSALNVGTVISTGTYKLGSHIIMTIPQMRIEHVLLRSWTDWKTFILEGIERKKFISGVRQIRILRPSSQMKRIKCIPWQSTRQCCIEFY
ncbi:hypothetical protein P280DRAFT_470217 [Massarina eburnea CBS 473.64]|uniref:Uncharacterized protein n=1 Tax=Massarina eburnea CBS 473.64 TaxID=1395130 RepID=A0A6A6S066_9PLEO|nr:hypothetical protein P280DRAFT_470217 [Massarina eburnea CBS 473.64]